MKKELLYLPLVFVLTFTFNSCSTEETIEPEETENSNVDLDPTDPDHENDWRTINIVGVWHLKYTLETTHDGIHVGITEKTYSKEYNYVKYEFNEDNTFVETTAEGESSEDVEITTRTGIYKARYPEGYSGKWLELSYENGDWDDDKFEINSDETQIKIDQGTTTNMSCGCSDNKKDIEQIYARVE